MVLPIPVSYTHLDVYKRQVLARFDILWMGFLLYSLLFAIGSLLYYGNHIIGKSHPGTGRFWLPALVFLISLLEEEGKGILDYFCLLYTSRCV